MLLQEIAGMSTPIPTVETTRAGRKEAKKLIKAVRKKGTCWVCHKEGADDYCSLCNKALYCSKACQVADWNRHKISDCRPVLPAKERKHA